MKYLDPGVFMAMQRYMSNVHYLCYNYHGYEDHYYLPVDASFGKLIALRDNLYYFHELASHEFAINRIFRNGTTIDLKVEKPFLEEYDENDFNYFMIDHIQLAPFSRRFLKNVKNYGHDLEYTKFD